MYKLLNSSITNKPSAILRLEDNVSIPFDEANTDYQAYLKFLSDGGQPLPADNNGQTA